MVDTPSPAALAKARRLFQDIGWNFDYQEREIALALDAWRAQALEEAAQECCRRAKGWGEDDLEYAVLMHTAAAIRALAPPTTLKESETP